MSIAAVNARCDCGKVVYVSRREALAAAKRMQGQRGGRAYRCPDGCWHLTSRSRAAKRHLPERAADPDAVKRSREARFARRVAKRRVETAPVLRVAQPKHTGPEHTRCSGCGRRWLSDCDPTNRRCPGCGAIGTYVIGWADRGKDWIRSLAA